MKKIGIVCDLWKTDKFEKRLTDEKFNLKSVVLDTTKSITHILIEVEDVKYESEAKRMKNVLSQLELELKQSN